MGWLKDVRALRSFTAFLVQHGRHLQWLTLECGDGTAEGEAAASGALAACLAIAGTVGQLAQLATTGRVHSAEWLVAMPSLRQLVLNARPHSSGLLISPAISAMTALTSLRLSGSISFQPGAALPIAVQDMTLDFDRQATFPEQASVCVLASCWDVPCFKQLHSASDLCTSARPSAA